MKRLEVEPISVDNVHVKIKCPHCAKIHIHGSCGGSGYAGYRTPHCEKSLGKKNYYILEV